MDVPSFLSALLASSAATAIVAWLTAPRSKARSLNARIEKWKALSKGLPADVQHEINNAIRVDTLRLIALSVVRWNARTSTIAIFILIMAAAATLTQIGTNGESISKLIGVYAIALVDYESLSTWLLLIATLLALIVVLAGIRFSINALLNSARESWVEERIHPTVKLPAVRWWASAYREVSQFLTSMLFAAQDIDHYPGYEGAAVQEAALAGAPSSAATPTEPGTGVVQQPSPSIMERLMAGLNAFKAPPDTRIRSSDRPRGFDPSFSLPRGRQRASAQPASWV